jgi:hypothetical protein
VFPVPLSTVAPGTFEITAMLTTEVVTRSVERPEALKPRLLNMRQAAEYLACSF